MIKKILLQVLFHLHNHYALVSAWRELAVDCLIKAPAPAATRDKGAGGAGEEGEGGVKSKVEGLGEVGGALGSGVAGGWASVDMARRRQVLTARLGQTQLHWVDFDGRISQNYSTYIVILIY